MKDSLVIYSKITQKFPYHLVTPSPWPIIVSFSLLSMALGAVLYMHGYPNGGYVLNIGFLSTLMSMIFWFKDINTEGTFLGLHTKEVQRGILIGMILFIISEVFAFLSVFWAYFHSSLSPTVEIGGVWPPQGIPTLDPFAIPLINTILLLSSGAFITYAHHGLINGNRKAAINGTLITIILAVIFTALQGIEYSQAGFTIADSVYGTVFFASTGLHGFHVIVGTIFIGVQFIRILNHHITTSHHVGLESSIAYWHFVDVVWLFLYAFVYLWSAPNL